MLVEPDKVKSGVPKDCFPVEYLFREANILCMAMYGYVGLCMAMKLYRAM